MTSLDAIIELTTTTQAQGFHLISGLPPLLRVGQSLEVAPFSPIDVDLLNHLIIQFAQPRELLELSQGGRVSIVRHNALHSHGGVRLDVSEHLGSLHIRGRVHLATPPERYRFYRWPNLAFEEGWLLVCGFGRTSQLRVLAAQLSLQGPKVAWVADKLEFESPRVHHLDWARAATNTESFDWTLLDAVDRPERARLLSQLLLVPQRLAVAVPAPTPLEALIWLGRQTSRPRFERFLKKLRGFAFQRWLTQGAQPVLQEQSGALNIDSLSFEPGPIDPYDLRALFLDERQT